MESKKLVEMVKQLREKTGAGVMDCKKALEEAEGDFEKAAKAIKAKGAAAAEKKKERETKEGYVATYTHATGKVGVVVELLCETDFVSRNEEFRLLAKELCLQIAAMAPKNEKALLKEEYIRDPAKTVEDFLKEAIAKFGENIKLGRFERIAI